MTRCPTCDTTWHGLTECHCATCHAHFGSIDAFDRHRQGPVDIRHCVDPATVLRKDGKPVLRAVDRSRSATAARRATERTALTWVVDKPARVFPVAGLDAAGSEPAPGCPSDPIRAASGNQNVGNSRSQ